MCMDVHTGLDSFLFGMHVLYLVAWVVLCLAWARLGVVAHWGFAGTLVAL